MKPLSIALVGNPNVGKTSLYNKITRSFNHVGNWHGVTVAEVSKTINYDGEEVAVSDLPGLYGLSVYSGEEAIARDAVLFNDYDAVVCVCEVNNLSRNLYLALQLIEAEVPVVVAVNMIDELEAAHKAFDAAKLESALGVPVVAVSAKRRSCVSVLMKAAVERAKSRKPNGTKLDYLKSLPIEKVKNLVGARAGKAGLKGNYAAIKLIEKDVFTAEKCALTAAETAKIDALGDFTDEVAALRYGFIDKAADGVIVADERFSQKRKRREKTNTFTDFDDKSGKKRVPTDVLRAKSRFDSRSGKIDKIVLNKFLALPIFFLAMFSVIAITFGVVGNRLADLLSDVIEKFVYTPVSLWLGNAGAPEWVVGLIGDGIINGVGGVLVFLPQIVLLFFFLALMEDSGYVSRVAFMTDGFFRKIGLSGRSVFTMLTGIGCSATAVLTARGLEDETMRKKTVILTPFISCSARLPVYTAIASAFFARGKILLVFSLYLLGAAVSIVAAAVMEKCTKRLKSGRLSFIMEMPPYRFPTVTRVFQLIAHNCKVFLVKVGTVIFAFNTIVWILSNFSLVGGFTGKADQSILATFSGLIAPFFAPLGFGNWQAVTALTGGFVAKEMVVSIIESLGGVEVIFTSAYPSVSAVAFAVYTLLYLPCVATLGAELKEVGWKWTAFGVALQSVVAYLCALIVRLVGVALTLNAGLTIGIAVAAIAFAVAALTTVNVYRGKKRCFGCDGDCSDGCRVARGVKNARRSR